MGIRTVLTFFGSWLLLAAAVGSSYWYFSLSALGCGFLMAALTVAFLSLVLAWPAMRAWVRQVDLGVLVGLHCTRFVGIAFLILGTRGELDSAFAMTGWADLVIAMCALFVSAKCLPMRRSTCVWMLGTWNATGLASAAASIGLGLAACYRDPISMLPLRTMPLALLPLFLVPIVITSHLALFFRLREAYQQMRPQPFSPVNLTPLTDTTTPFS